MAIDLNDLKMMYEGCLCRYGDQAILLTDFLSDKEIEFLYLKTGEYGIAPFDLKEFDFTPLRIGYINYRGIAFYFVRQPIRQYKQGTCSSNTFNSGNYLFKGKDQTMRKRWQGHAHEIGQFNCKEIADAIDKNYPTVKEIIGIFATNKYAYSMAFDTQFALTFEGNILYKDKIVGTFTPDGKLTFQAGFEYLEIICNVNL